MEWHELEKYLNNYLIIGDSISIVQENGVKKNIPQVAHLWSAMSPDVNYVFDSINRGSTFILHKFSRFSETINGVCSSIESNFRKTQVDVHLYAGLSPKSSSFFAHWDFPDNFIIQQDGCCEWTIFNESASVENVERIRYDHESTLSTDFKIISNPGDVIFIPAFRYHKCIPLSRRISLSIPVPRDCVGSDRTWYRLEYDR